MQTAAHALRNGFTQIPNALFDTPLLTGSEKIVISALKSYCWDKANCWPSRDTLAANTGISKRRLCDVFAGLRDKKAIVYKRRGYGNSNEYHFLDPSIEAMIQRLQDEANAKVGATSPGDHSDLHNPVEPQLVQPADQATPAQPIITKPTPPPAKLPAEKTSMVKVQTQKPATIQSQSSKKSPVSPLGSISAETASHSCADSAPLLYKKTQPYENSVKNTQSKAQARVCVPKSQFTLALCITFAMSLRTSGITNPWAYGTAIWQDGREDKRISEFQADQEKLKASIPITADVITTGYDKQCPHCSGYGLRYKNSWLSDEMIGCDCNRRGRDALQN